jgi:hypothetical protein
MLHMRLIPLALAAIYLSTLTLAKRLVWIVWKIIYMIPFNKNVSDVQQTNQFSQVNFVNLVLWIHILTCLLRLARLATWAESIMQISKIANVLLMLLSLQTLHVFNVIFLNISTLFLKVVFHVLSIRLMILTVIVAKVALMINLCFVLTNVWSALSINITTKQPLPVNLVQKDYHLILPWRSANV